MVVLAIVLYVISMILHILCSQGCNIPRFPGHIYMPVIYEIMSANSPVSPMGIQQYFITLTSQRISYSFKHRKKSHKFLQKQKYDKHEVLVLVQTRNTNEDNLCNCTSFWFLSGCQKICLQLKQEPMLGCPSFVSSFYTSITFFWGRLETWLGHFLPHYFKFIPPIFCYFQPCHATISPKTKQQINSYFQILYKVIGK